MHLYLLSRHLDTGLCVIDAGLLVTGLLVVVLGGGLVVVVGDGGGVNPELQVPHD